MSVTTRFDVKVRRQLAAHLRRAPELLRLGAPEHAGHWIWRLRAESAALIDGPVRLGLLHSRVTEINTRASGLAGLTADE